MASRYLFAEISREAGNWDLNYAKAMARLEDEVYIEWKIQAPAFQNGPRLLEPTYDVYQDEGSIKLGRFREPTHRQWLDEQLQADPKPVILGVIRAYRLSKDETSLEGFVIEVLTGGDASTHNLWSKRRWLRTATQILWVTALAAIGLWWWYTGSYPD